MSSNLRFDFDNFTCWNSLQNIKHNHYKTETTASAQIERHSWLESQGAKNRANFIVLCGKNVPKMTIVWNQKVLNFNRTPALYLRRYGNIARKLVTKNRKVFKLHLFKIWVFFDNHFSGLSVLVSKYGVRSLKALRQHCQDYDYPQCAPVIHSFLQ